MCERASKVQQLKFLRKVLKMLSDRFDLYACSQAHGVLLYQLKVLRERERERDEQVSR